MTEQMSSRCSLCGLVDFDAVKVYNIAIANTSNKNLSQTQSISLCDRCKDNMSVHAKNYTLIHNSIMNKRWTSLHNVYFNNTLRHRDKDNKDMVGIEERFWRERLAMYMLCCTKPDTYSVRLYMEKWLSKLSLEEVLKQCSMLFRDPEDWQEHIRINLSRKQREKILTQGALANE